MTELDILNGFVSKIISDCVDITKDLIRKADKNRTDKNQNPQTRIYQVTIDVLNEFPYNKYKKEEKVYDAAESILKQLKSCRGDYKEAVRAGLKIIVSQVTSDICEEFLEALCNEICKKENIDLAIRHIVHQEKQINEQQKQMNKYMQEGFKESCQNEEEILRELSDIKENLNSQKNCRTEQNNEISVENKARYYADKWEENVFLNNFDEEDERAGDRVNVKLKDIYLDELLPTYILNENQNISFNLKTRLEKYIVYKNDREMLLILGQPGIGKSTLITWIMANFAEKKDEIFVYQFASDLKQVNWRGEDILKEIFKVLCLKEEEVKDKILILDGFDEISISGGRERILNKLYQELKNRNRLGDFSLIITCRENYVNQSYLSVKTYITLQAWNEEQIKSFCNIYEKKSSGNLEAKFPEAKSNEILKNIEIYGIPLILYMILALDITIEKSSSIVDVYDQIFSLEKGVIYDRCYDSEHRLNDPEIKKCIHQISQKTAFWIFENNADAAVIYQKNFKEICDTVILEAKDKSEDMQSNALIGSYFKVKHCDGEQADEVNFVHRSIYEYFVAVYFFESICNLTSKEEVAGKLGELLKDGHLSRQMLEFIKYKFDSVKGYNLPDITKKIFNIMLRDGMTYHFIEQQKEPIPNILVREINIFSNMLEIIHLWHDKLEGMDKKINVYSQYNCLNKINLVGTDLSEAYLRGAVFDEKQIEWLCKKYDLSGSKVYLSETEKIISYKRYCIRKRKERI